MTALRTKLAAITLIAGTLAVTGGSVFVQDRHPVVCENSAEAGSAESRRIAAVEETCASGTSANLTAHDTCAY